MDESVIRSMARWPDVPAVFGWLALDRRGRWLLQGREVTHPLSLNFINRHYAGDEQGRWYFQNGPQQVFVDLAYTPWVLRLSGRGELVTHTGKTIEQVSAAYLDEHWQLVLVTEQGPGLIDDRDLTQFESRLTTGENIREGCPEGSLPQTMSLVFGDREVAVQRLISKTIGRVLGFDPRPRA